MRRGIVALVFRGRGVGGQVGVSAEAAKVAWLRVGLKMKDLVG
jgi:hypothetical protein